MLPDRVNVMLGNYKEYRARCLHLEKEIRSMELELVEMRKNSFSDNVPISGQKIDGMPHGSSVGSPTDRFAIKLADGYKPPYYTKAEAELKEAKQEYKYKIQTVIFVEAWLKGLTERERWIVEGHIINLVSWKELILDYSRLFGEDKSKRSLQRLQQDALMKIYRIAE